MNIYGAVCCRAARPALAHEHLHDRCTGLQDMQARAVDGHHVASDIRCQQHGLRPSHSCQQPSVQGSMAAMLIPKPPGGSSACSTLGTVQRGPGGLTVAWRHDALDEASPAGNLPVERAKPLSLQPVHMPHGVVALVACAGQPGLRSCWLCSA